MSLEPTKEDQTTWFRGEYRSIDYVKQKEKKERQQDNSKTRPKVPHKQ